MAYVPPPPNGRFETAMRDAARSRDDELVAAADRRREARNDRRRRGGGRLRRALHRVADVVSTEERPS